MVVVVDKSGKVTGKQREDYVMIVADNRRESAKAILAFGLASGFVKLVGYPAQTHDFSDGLGNGGVFGG